MSERKLNRFDVIAPYYDRLATLVFGKAIKQAQLTHLKSIPAAAHILVLGGGTGWWLNELLKTNTKCTIHYIDASTEMLRLAKLNSKDSSRIHFVHGTDTDIPAIHFDAVITYFFLDMFEEDQLIQVVTRIGKSMKPNTIWIVSEFANGRYWHKALLWVMYWFFRTTRAIDSEKLPQWKNTMEANGFKLRKSKTYFGEFIYSQIYLNC